MAKQENTATARGDGLPISSKVAVEICGHIRNKPLQKAKKILEEVQTMKKAIPFKKMAGCGHRKGMGPGRYPIKACGEMLKLLKSAEANAQFKGLNTNSLVITKIVSNEAAGQWHYGRHRRRKQKSTHVEVILTEKEVKGEKKAEAKPEAKKEPAKAEPKPVEKKEAPAAEKKPEAKKEPVKSEAKPAEKKEEEKKAEAKPVEKKESPKAPAKDKPTEEKK